MTFLNIKKKFNDTQKNGKISLNIFFSTDSTLYVYTFYKSHNNTLLLLKTKFEVRNQK